MNDPTEKYESFGPEWVKEMMRFTKKELVELLKQAYRERKRLRK